jgi:hypothetical protein
MKLGEVYIWETEKVEGHDKRIKRHVYIFREDSRHYFLFINKADWYKDHKILKENYDTFLEYDSYIGGNAVIDYSDFEMRSATLVGAISPADLKLLRDAIIAAETMERQDMNRVCKALAAVL